MRRRPLAGLAIVPWLPLLAWLVAAGSGPEAIRSRTGVPMIVIPAGWFAMGSARGRADEAPVHRVWVAAFCMDSTEVTQQRYGELILGNPSHFKGPKNPVEQVSWPAAARYCNARSRAEGLEPCYDEKTAACNFAATGYRLPTEAEWEYACRAGGEAEYGFSGGADKLGEYAWYDGNSVGTTHPVGMKKPNAWGLYDLHGNVGEWCGDRYDPRYYATSPEKSPHGPTKGQACVLRGGAWNSVAEECRAAYRQPEEPGFGVPCFRGDHIGFRCVRKAP